MSKAKLWPNNQLTFVLVIAHITGSIFSFFHHLFEDPFLTFVFWFTEGFWQQYTGVANWTQKGVKKENRTKNASTAQPMLNSNTKEAKSDEALTKFYNVGCARFGLRFLILLFWSFYRWANIFFCLLLLFLLDSSVPSLLASAWAQVESLFGILHVTVKNLCQILYTPSSHQAWTTRSFELYRKKHFFLLSWTFECKLIQ